MATDRLLFSREDAETVWRFHDSKRPKCSYCGSDSHIIQRCEVYDFHHDMGSEEDKEWIEGRKMVLARRMAKHFGGIPEEYISNPTPEQAAVAHAYRAERERKWKAAVLEVIKICPIRAARIREGKKV